MYSTLKLYLLFIPYIVVVLFVQGAELRGNAIEFIVWLFLAISTISSLLYCYNFLKIYKNKKATWHSLGHLFFFAISCFLSSFVYLTTYPIENGMRDGKIMLIIISSYFGLALPIIVSIVLSAVMLLLKSYFTAKKPSHSVEPQQHTP